MKRKKKNNNVNISNLIYCRMTLVIQRIIIKVKIVQITINQNSNTKKKEVKERISEILKIKLMIIIL